MCGSPRVIYITSFSIKKGDELFTNYGKKFIFGSPTGMPKKVDATHYKKMSIPVGSQDPPGAPIKKNSGRAKRAITGGVKRRLEFSDSIEEPLKKKQKLDEPDLKGPDPAGVEVKTTLKDCGLSHLTDKIMELGVVNMTLLPLLKQTELYSNLPVIQRIALDIIIQKKNNLETPPSYK